MKHLNEYISEMFLIDDDVHIQDYKYHPINKNELSEIINKKVFAHKDKDEVLDLNDIDTSKILDMGMLFYNQPKLSKIDITYWETQKLKNMNNMFAGCTNLKSIGNISDWNVSKLISMKNAFAFCKNLTDIGDLNNWEINSELNADNAFKNSGITPPKWAS